MLKLSLSQGLPDNLPQTPGIYMYTNKEGEVIYIGKAKNLKSRISSYFATNVSGKTATMISEATNISIIQVNSEIEALLLEAKLVRRLLPKYNIELRDDKSPLYICITAEKYPRVLMLRKTQLTTEKYIFGPFTEGYNTRKIMKLLRRVFPYSQHKPDKKVCIYRQIGLCFPCPSEIEMEQDPIKKAELKKQFNQNLQKIRKFLRGDFQSLKKSLEKEMKLKSTEQNFEQAASLREQIRAIDVITTPAVSPWEYIKDPNLIEEIRRKEIIELKSLLAPYFPSLTNISKIECFDIAHLAGTNPTASMVTFINGDADKNYYRHFTIKRKKGNSDVDNMKEVLSRRSRHWGDWGIPDLIIVDGGKPQVSAALEIINNIPLIGLAKQFETIVVKTEKVFDVIRLPRGGAKNLVQRMRDEAHRFARRLHHKHVAKSLKIGL